MWNTKRILTYQEAASRLRVEVDDLRHEVECGRLASFRVGGKPRIAVDDLKALLSAQGASTSALDNPNFRLKTGVAVVALLLAGSLLANVDFPFPRWGETRIVSQIAEFVDPAASTQPDPARFQPLNAPIHYRRFNDAPNPEGAGFTHSLSAFQLQNVLEPDSLSFPWTSYFGLDTNHDRGDGVGNLVQLRNRGKGWSAAYHADVFAYGPGAAIGSNIETLDVGDERAFLVGMNVQNKAFRGDVGIQVQTGPLPPDHPLWQPGMDGGWETGMRLSGRPGAGFYRTGIELDRHTHGQRGMWMRGDFDIGIDLGANSLRVDSDTPIELNGAGGIALRFNSSRGRIEFVNGNSVIAWLPANARNVNLAQ